MKGWQPCVVAALAFARRRRGRYEGAEEAARRKASSPGTPPTIVRSAEELGAEFTDLR